MEKDDKVTVIGISPVSVWGPLASPFRGFEHIIAMRVPASKSANGGAKLARLRQLGPLTDDNLLIFRDRTPKGRHYTERPGAPPTRLQDSSFGAGCFGNAKSS